MAHAKLEMLVSKQLNEAILEFNGNDYPVKYTHIDYLKAMNIYGQLDKVKDASSINWLESCGTIVTIYDEAERILKSMIGNASLSAVLHEADVKLDIDSVTRILAACVAAISNKIKAEEDEKLRTELQKLDNI